MMSEIINDFEEIVRVMDPVDDILFGVRLETETVAAAVDKVPVACLMTGMYSVRPGLVSFRIIFDVNADILSSAQIDVAVNYSAPEEAVFGRGAFFRFANSVAAPHVRSYAQSILDGLLTQMKLPDKLLPPVRAFEKGPFRGDSAPEFISPAE